MHAPSPPGLTALHAFFLLTSQRITKLLQPLLHFLILPREAIRLATQPVEAREGERWPKV
jgi:hypothetical protein